MITWRLTSVDCNGNTVIQITDILKRRKFIQPTPGYKRKGFPQSGQPKYRVACSDDIHHRIQNEVFDPLAKIGHHVSIQVALGILALNKYSTSKRFSTDQQEYRKLFNKDPMPARIPKMGISTWTLAPPMSRQRNLVLAPKLPE